MNKTTATYFNTRFFVYIGPIALSAFSLFLTYQLLQPVALWLDPSFSLLASRSVGKIAFTLAVLMHIALLLTTVSQQFMHHICAINILFFRTSRWLKDFFTTFILFFCLHSVLLACFSWVGWATFNPSVLSLVPTKFFSLLWGFIATFFLAWTEEMIFRGTLFPFFKQGLSNLTSALMTSVIFMLVHNITHPLELVTTQWKLGLGLFLLGFLLNLVFIISQKLYVGMGVHAGLVYVKVFLRRIPCITYASSLPWWLNSDLRQSLITHLLFAVVITFLLIRARKSLKI